MQSQTLSNILELYGKQKPDKTWSGKYAECEFEQAVVYFNQALQNNPDDFDTLISRGVAKGQLDMHEDAIRDYTAALAIDPKQRCAICPELILARLHRLEMIYHTATESNEYCISEDVQHLLEQIALWDRTMKRRDSIKGKHHLETIEFMRKFIKALEEFLDGGAELFPFEMIDKLTKEYLD